MAPITALARAADRRGGRLGDRFVQISDPAEEDSHYWGVVPARMRAIDTWIGAVPFLGRGYGTRIMHLALARCFAPPDVEVGRSGDVAVGWRARPAVARLSGFAGVAFGAAPLDAAAFVLGLMTVTLSGAPLRSSVVDSPTCSPASTDPDRRHAPSLRYHSQ